MHKISRRDFIRISSGTLMTFTSIVPVIGCGTSSSSTSVEDEPDPYRRLQIAMDTIPNGFPATSDEIEIELLKMIFSPEEAELCCDLRLTFETARQIAERTGRPYAGLEVMLINMSSKGQIYGMEYGDIKIFRMIPWLVGLYETQVFRQGPEFYDLNNIYSFSFHEQQKNSTPQLFKIVPVAETIPAGQRAMPYQDVASIIESGVEFFVMECVCKKAQADSGEPCTKPTEVCLQIFALSDLDFLPGVMMSGRRKITKEEAYQILDDAEAAGLLHMSSNVQTGGSFICNCCSCCCGWLRKNKGTTDISLLVNSEYMSEIDPTQCWGCGTCINSRCQAEAIEPDGSIYRVLPDCCIGCGLCVSACPSGAAQLQRKPESQITPTPYDMEAWNDQRAQSRGIDYSKYK